MTDIVIDWVAHHALASPTKVATIDLASGRRQNYAEMHDRVGRIAHFLRNAGVEKGDRVGLIALNSSDVLDIIFATWRIGAVHLALNFRLTPPELAFILGDADPKLVIADQVSPSWWRPCKARRPVSAGWKPMGWVGKPNLNRRSVSWIRLKRSSRWYPLTRRC